MPYVLIAVAAALVTFAVLDSLVPERLTGESSGGPADATALASASASGAPIPSVSYTPPPETEPPRDLLTSAVARLWLDGADESSLLGPDEQPTPPGGPVAIWLDRSGQGNNAYQIAPEEQPARHVLGDRSSVAFDGTQWFAFDPAKLPTGSTPSAVYVVAAQEDPQPDMSCFRHLLVWGLGEPNQARIISKGCETSLAYAETFGTFSEQDATLGWPLFEPALLSAEFTYPGVVVRMNGAVSYRWEANSSTGIVTGNGPAQLAAAPWDPTRNWQGRIAEVIVLAAVPTAEQNQEIERYLAGKWKIGLVP